MSKSIPQTDEKKPQARQRQKRTASGPASGLCRFDDPYFAPDGMGEPEISTRFKYKNAFAAAAADRAAFQHIKTEIETTPAGVRFRVFFRWRGDTYTSDWRCTAGELALVPGQSDGQSPAPGGSPDPDGRPNEHTDADPDAQQHADAHEHTDTHVD